MGIYERFRENKESEIARETAKQLEKTNKLFSNKPYSLIHWDKWKYKRHMVKQQVFFSLIENREKNRFQ
jgi:hypothetical protein